MNPIDFFWRSVRRAPDRPAVFSREGSLSYVELASRVRSRATGLREADPAPGSLICVGGDNSVEHLVTMLAVLAADKVWVPLNPRNGDPELVRIIEFTQAKCSLVDEPLAARLAGIAGVETFAAVDGREAGILAPASTRPLGAAQAIKFTGGTTGTPKGVQQTLRAWNTNIVTQVHEIGLKPHDRYLVAAPLTHGTSTYVLPTLAVGGALVFPSEQGTGGLLDAIAERRATYSFGPPALISMLAAEQRRTPRALPSLRCLIAGGAAMRADQVAEAQAAFGPVLAVTFGQTEAPQIAAWLPSEDMVGERIMSAGRATLLTEIAIIGENGDLLAAGEEGEVAIRGDLVMSGYLNSSDETAKVLVDGWLRTGDVGMLDNEGYLFIRDRLRDIIITGGFNVFPSDVEAVLGNHPAVADCSVIGVADAKWGEAVHAAVQPSDPGNWNEASVIAAVKAALGPVKTPKAVHLFEQLPRSPVGKILKSAIRDEISARIAANENTDC